MMFSAAGSVKDEFNQKVQRLQKAPKLECVAGFGITLLSQH